MGDISPEALQGASPANRAAIERLARLPDAPPVSSAVSRKAQAAVAAVLFEAPSRAHSRHDIPASKSHGAEAHWPSGTDGEEQFEPELHVVCTTRALHLSSHPGQASLPGGKVDAGDKSPADTAFRETCEEIGLDEGSIERGECVLLGTMRPFISKTALLVHPVVFWLPPKTAQRILASLWASPDEVSALWSFPLRGVLTSEPPRQIRKSSLVANGCSGDLQYGEPLMALEDANRVDRHRPPQTAFRTYSDVPWLLNGAYRLHRFRSTHQLIKGLTADVLMHIASHAYRGTPWAGPMFPVFSPSQASWDDCVAYIVERNMKGAPRLQGRWGDGESGDSYGSVDRHQTIVGWDWDVLLAGGEQQKQQPHSWRHRDEDEGLTRRDDPAPWCQEEEQRSNGKGGDAAHAPGQGDTLIPAT